MPTASQSYFEIRTSPIQGRGAFATRRIRKGTRLIEYVGERISHAEADRRYDDDTMKRHHTFLFTLNNRTVIDAAVNGNEARFINHSCSPNCEAVIDSGHIYIETVKTIQPEEELVYDYQYERAPGADESDEARYPCRCGSPNCRGTILAPPKRKRAAAGAKRGKAAGKRKKTVSRRKKSTAKRGKSTAKRGKKAPSGGRKTVSKRGKTSAQRKKSTSAGRKKSTSAGRKKTTGAGRKKTSGAGRTKTTSQRSAPATRGGTLMRKARKGSSRRARKSSGVAKNARGSREATRNQLKAAARRRRSA